MNVFAAYFLPPRTILASARASIGIAAAVGLPLAITVDWRILPVGVAGLVLGNCFLFLHLLSWAAALAGVIAGLWVDAILYIGNVPDMEAD